VNLVDPSGLNLEGICIRYHYSNGAGVGFWGEWTCYGGGGGGDYTAGGGGGGSQAHAQNSSQQSSPQKQKKSKCKQNKDGSDIPDIKAKLGEAGVTGEISNIRRALPNSPEGILFDITNRETFVGIVKSSKKFTHDVPVDHLKQVGGNARNTDGFRSYTDKDGLGMDSTGFTRSLQIAVGPSNRTTGIATGYADLDCSNPDQDLVSAIKHLFGH